MLSEERLLEVNSFGRKSERFDARHTVQHVMHLDPGLQIKTI